MSQAVIQAMLERRELTRRDSREGELRRLNPALRNTDLSVLTETQIDGLISAAIRSGQTGPRRRIKRRR